MITTKRDDRIAPVNLDTRNSMALIPRTNVDGSATTSFYEFDGFKVVDV